MDTYRIMIVADDPLARAGLAALLATHCTLAGQVAPQDAARDLSVYRPDALLWDVGWDADPGALPDFSDFEQPVIALLADDALAADVQAAGARGVLRRDSAPECMIAAAAAAIAGLIVLDPAFAPVVDLIPRQPAVDLTPRELDVLRLLAEGRANRAIAQQLAISEHTVKFHLNAILSKLAAQSRTEAVVNAIRLGVIAV